MRCKVWFCMCLSLILNDAGGVLLGQTPPQSPPGYVAEAPLPEGFPLPGEPGKVIEKSYPRARSYSASGRGAFMKCFAYLSKNKHEMTAPVVMEYDNEAGVEAKGDDMPVPVTRMHFLLEKISQDEPRTEGDVTVADMAELHVLSIASQGRMTAERIKELEEKLRGHLAARADLRKAGALRILGYNGPAVPRDKVYWEVQLPVKPADQN
jgi:hypothetical protein